MPAYNQYARKATDIVAYTFNAETLCPGDMRQVAIAALLEVEGIAGELLRPETPMEKILDRWAEVAKVEREDEYSFDSDDFPKVVFDSQLLDGECCDRCGGEL